MWWPLPTNSPPIMCWKHRLSLRCALVIRSEVSVVQLCPNYRARNCIQEVPAWGAAYARTRALQDWVIAVDATSSSYFNTSGWPTAVCLLAMITFVADLQQLNPIDSLTRCTSWCKSREGRQARRENDLTAAVKWVWVSQRLKIHTQVASFVAIRAPKSFIRQRLSCIVPDWVGHTSIEYCLLSTSQLGHIIPLSCFPTYGAFRWLYSSLGWAKTALTQWWSFVSVQ